MSMPQITTLDKLQRDTHDRVIRMEVKMDSVLTELKEIKDGTAEKLANHEMRIATIEKEHNLIGGPQVAYQELLKVKESVTNAKVWAAGFGAAAGSIPFILAQLPNWLKPFE